MNTQLTMQSIINENIGSYVEDNEKFILIS